MKSSLILILFVSTNLFSQIDSTIVKNSWYGRMMPLSLYTGAGYLKDKISQNIEFGRSIGVLDVGIAYGKISQRPDTTNYLEGRITIDACQLGPISNEFTIGGGVVLNSKTPIMLEISYTILYQVHKKIGIGVISGYYDFSGNISDVNKTFFGIFLRYGLLRSANGGLLNSKFKTHHHHM